MAHLVVDDKQQSAKKSYFSSVNTSHNNRTFLVLKILQKQSFYIIIFNNYIARKLCRKENNRL